MLSPRSYLVSRQSQLHAANKPGRTPSPLSQSSSIQAGCSTRKDERSTRHSLPSSASNSRESSTGDGNYTMSVKRKEPSSRGSSPAASPPKIAANSLTRPTTPTSPVQIPVKSKHTTAHAPSKSRRHHRDDANRSHTSHPRSSVHNADAIPASVAALLAVTNIPPSRRSRMGASVREKRMTVDSIIAQAQEAEKEFSLTLSKSPLDVLLSPPEDVSDVTSVSDSMLGSALSTRTVSLESMPSVESFSTAMSSMDSPSTPARDRKPRPTRRSLTPVSSPGSDLEDHPLSGPRVDLDELDFTIFEPPRKTGEKAEAALAFPFRPFRSAFKSNLTASLRALRNAARSFSNLNLTSIPPEDFLTRSILTLEPSIPYTDERRPPPLEEAPSAELRRYLNPTTSARLEKRSTTSPSGPTRATFTASIQMHTYKVHRARSSPSVPTKPVSSRPIVSALQTTRDPPLEYPVPGPRQREVRENSDFIRIAVMEMAMRRNNKLDDHKPGRARLALPPRKTSAKPYEIGADGVPARWVAITY